MANEHRAGMTSARSGFISRFTLGSGALTFAAKDTLDIAGYPTRAGSPVLQDAPEATAHAAVIQQLLDSGCQLRGKTTLHELAFGVTGINAWSGTPINPRYPAVRRAVRQPWWPPERSILRLAPIPGVPCGCLPPAAASSA